MGPYEFSRDDLAGLVHERHFATKISGDEMKFERCPFCNGGAHRDYWTFSVNMRTGAWNCARGSCGRRGKFVELCQELGYSLGNGIDDYYSRQVRYRSFLRKGKIEPKPRAVEYLNKRGISTAVVEKYEITTKKDNDGVLVFPFIDEAGTMWFVKYRNMDFQKGITDGSKEWCERGRKPILFGMNHCDPEKSDVLVLTEGQIDSLSVAEAGIDNAVSVPMGKNNWTWVPYCWDFLCKFKTLIVFGDHEHGMITLLDDMRTKFHGTVKAVREEDYLDCKDANDILRKHGRQAVRNAVENAAPVPVRKTVNLAKVTRKNLAKREKISSGIQSLDNIIGGFYFGDVVLVTGERGGGKSTLDSQFATFAVNQGARVFFYSGEMDNSTFREWFDTQCAGSVHLQAERIPGTDLTDYFVSDEAAEAIADWYDGMVYLYDNTFTEDDIDERQNVLDIAERMIVDFGCRVLFIDNLMTAIDDDTDIDANRQQTRFMKKLVLMARRYNVLIFLVAHPRKKSGRVSFDPDDVSGSATITNLANVIIRYTRPDDKDPECDRLLCVYKNRNNGKICTEGIPLFYEASSRRIIDATKRKGEDTVRAHFNWSLHWEDKFFSSDQEERDIFGD